MIPTRMDSFMVLGRKLLVVESEYVMEKWKAHIKKFDGLKWN